VLKKLRLTRFKNFKKAELVLGPFSLLVGTNASGKSNIRDAFRFLHGISRGYMLAEIIGEKWVEGGVLQWRGIRGGTREAAFQQSASFALEIEFSVPGESRRIDGSYRIEVDVGENGRAPRVAAERLIVAGRGQYVFDSHPENYPPEQTDPFHLGVRLRKAGQSGWFGRQLNFVNNKPVLYQVLDHPDVEPKTVREHARAALRALESMRFLDLDPDAMRRPSVPGQTILGDRGENLSSVLQAICENPTMKQALAAWIRELTPMDASDFEFPSDQTGRILASLVEKSGQRTSAYSASDGTLRFLAMIAALIGPEPARFYFFEELDNGIHPTRLHLLLQLIERKVTEGTIQMVASSHSPQLLAALSRDALESASLVYRFADENEAHIRRLLDLPEAQRVVEMQDTSRLLSSGWLEDAVAFTRGEEEEV
jgi:predicted ATPase